GTPAHRRLRGPDRPNPCRRQPRQASPGCGIGLDPGADPWLRPRQARPSRQGDETPGGTAERIPGADYETDGCRIGRLADLSMNHGVSSQTCNQIWIDASFMIGLMTRDS